MHNILKQNGIKKFDDKNLKITPADGAIISIDSLFKHNITSIKIKKVSKEPRKIKIIWNGVESFSNTRTLKYLLEGMLFFKLINFTEAKSFDSFAKYTDTFREKEKELLIINTDVYNNIHEYIEDNKTEICKYINQNLNFKWNGQLFFQKILTASYKSYKWTKDAKDTNKNEKKIQYTYSKVFEVLFLDDKNNIENTPKFLKLNKLKTINPHISEKDIKNIKDILAKNPQELNHNKNIMKLRRLFKSKLVAQVVEDYKNKINENTLLKDFPVLEGAHIIPVKELISNNEINEISNHNNGFLIDPNLHKMFDNGKVTMKIRDETIEFIDCNKHVWGSIEKKYISSERNKWIMKAM